MTMFGSESTDPLLLMEETVRLLELEKNKQADPDTTRNYNTLIDSIKMASAYYQICIIAAYVLQVPSGDLQKSTYRID